MVSIADYMMNNQNMGQPTGATMLPSANQPNQNYNLGDVISQLSSGGNQLPQVQPQANDIGSLIAQLTGNQSQQVPQAQVGNQVPQGDMSVGGNPATLSNRIQQFLGAKQPDLGGMAQDILAGRFQPPEFNINDVGTAAQATAASGQYVPAQQVANQRLATAMSSLGDIGKLQEQQAQANMYNAMAQNGGGRGEGLAAANRIKTEWDTNHPDHPMSWTDAYMQATAKQGQGVTIDPVTGQVTTMAGAPQAVGAMKQGAETGTLTAKLRLEPTIAGQTQVAKNNANIAAAGPEEAAREVGKATGEAQVSLASIKANMPQINSIVSNLRTLGQTATYTKAGQAYNSGLRQLGLPVPQEGVDRAQYESVVNNFLLPTLKQTFGARITNFDLQNIKTTLASSDLSPAEKDAQLKAFIQQKTMQIGTDQRSVESLGAKPLQNSNPDTSGPVVDYKDYFK